MTKRWLKTVITTFRTIFSLNASFVLIITWHTPRSNRTVPVGIWQFLPKCILRYRVHSTAKIHFTFHKEAEPQMEVSFSLTTEKVLGVYRQRTGAMLQLLISPSFAAHPVPRKNSG